MTTSRPINLHLSKESSESCIAQSDPWVVDQDIKRIGKVWRNCIKLARRASPSPSHHVTLGQFTCDEHHIRQCSMPMPMGLNIRECHGSM